jgi:uncharacterized protein HemY
VLKKSIFLPLSLFICVLGGIVALGESNKVSFQISPENITIGILSFFFGGLAIVVLFWYYLRESNTIIKLIATSNSNNPHGPQQNLEIGPEGVKITIVFPRQEDKKRSENAQYMKC